MATLSRATWENQEFVGSISMYVGTLYELFSNKDFPTELSIPNESWKPFISLVYKGKNLPEPTYEIRNELIPDYGLVTSDESKVILAFSGGKDSTANLTYLLDEGKEVTCVFTKGINRSATEELSHATTIANMYNTNLVIDKISISGKTDYFENPVKNIFIISRLLEYGIKNNCTVISIGETHNLKSDELDIMYNYSDATDLLQLFEDAVKSHIPTFKIDWIFKEESTDISYLIYYHPEVIPHLMSCLMPSRYKQMQRKFIEKYHLNADVSDPHKEGIMEGRCMNCWKCMAEWLYLVTWNKLPANKEYFNSKVIPTAIKKIGQLDKKLENKNGSLTYREILNSLVEYDSLIKYVKDPSLIKKDSYHHHPELSNCKKED